MAPGSCWRRPLVEAGSNGGFMDGGTELENAGLWIARAAGRYAVWLVVIWATYTAYNLAALRDIPDARIGIALVTVALPFCLGLPTLILIALLAPARRFPWHRPATALLLCAPALVARNSGWPMLVALLLFQTVFGTIVLPHPRPASARRTR
ncbi:hypothetical protein KCH_00360 [Kitasatospora cheerisanensis KCTC 2395]|uniref:Uncharacterized protein n=2 Tax=Kitasatospora cheerisanensis TaxID=81942 RepID=A0A066ZD11_9ACTN|nr:hypothetical protein KCH_00360 [Kitasatospora cheerisanensis KCTC 2395]